MKLIEVVKKNRSYRRYFQDEKITPQMLTELVRLARFSATGGNIQPLRFILSCDTEKNSKIFSCLKWAMMLKDWKGPEEGERPSAYIVILRKKDIVSPNSLDAGIAAQSILLGAVEKGYGGCMFGSVNKPLLTELLNIDGNKFRIELVVALGKPAEEIVVDEIVEGQDTRYYRDKNDVHHVPKISIKDLIIK
ncbi:MAG: nitroreductase family protein [Candidatus Delongbacteria bacterium]